MKKWICVAIVLVSMCFSSVVHSEEQQKYLFQKVKQNHPVPFTGLLVDEDTAMKIAQDQVELKDLRQTKHVQGLVWAFKEKTYEETIKKQQEIIGRMQRSWWDKNKLVVGVVIGFVTGVLSVYGVYELAQRQTK